MLRKYIAVFLFAAFPLVACDYETNTGAEDIGAADTEENNGVAGIGEDNELGAEPDEEELGAPRERDMDTRTGGLRTRPGTNIDPDTGTSPGTATNPGTGSIPEETFPEADPDTGGTAGEGAAGSS